MSLKDTLNERYLGRLLASPEGRAHVLAQLAEAEESSEGQIFERLLAGTDDPELARLIRRHHDDERRHAELFRGCLARMDVPVPTIPPELRMIDELDGALGGLLTGPVEGPHVVMESYLLLQVIEERAITEFAMFEPLFRRVDPATADVLLEVGRDEERHLKYCHAIARRYAPDAATHARTLRRFRTVEARVFTANLQRNMRHSLACGYVTAPPLEMLFWRALAGLAARLPIPQRTRYWGEALAFTRQAAAA